MDQDLQSFKASHAAFIERRRALVAAGADPKLASALANAGVENVEFLSGETWEGSGGLRERLAGARLVGHGLLVAAEAFLRRARAG
jgi:hypothetical protein